MRKRPTDELVLQAPTPGARRDADFYETRPEHIDNLVDWLAARTDLETLFLGATALEPCVGSGNIVRGFVRRGLCIDWYTNDIKQYEGIEPDTLMDATTDEYWRSAPPVDWVITNPPFNEAHHIVPRAVAHARAGAIVLLRSTWMEPRPNRARFLSSRPPTHEIMQIRASMNGTGSVDSAPTNWYIWSALVPPGISVIDPATRGMAALL